MTQSVGTAFDTARRTITDTDIINFAGLSGDFNPLHVDDLFAAEASPFGKRIAHGQLIASIVTGLASPLDDWPVLSYIGAKRRFSAPVFAGDTIHGRYSVSESRPSSSQPGTSVVTLALEVVNQSGEVVMSGDDVMLVADAELSAEAA
jgi:acyl dehydratase